MANHLEYAREAKDSLVIRTRYFLRIWIQQIYDLYYLNYKKINVIKKIFFDLKINKKVLKIRFTYRVGIPEKS